MHRTTRRKLILSLSFINRPVNRLTFQSDTLAKFINPLEATPTATYMQRRAQRSLTRAQLRHAHITEYIPRQSKRNRRIFLS